MNDKLITLTKELRFKSNGIDKDDFIDDKCVLYTKEHQNKLYYLWMCELKRWFKTEHDIDVCSRPVLYTDNYAWVILKSFDWVYGSEDFTSDPEALEAGLIKACEIVKTEKGL